MRKIVLLAALCSLVLTGCVSSRITNLTTTQQPRNPSGVYPIELVWDSNQSSIIDGSIKSYVVVDLASGADVYPMRPALNIANRWETVIPIPANQSSTVYHFKVDYQYRGFGGPEKDSQLSPSYKLIIVEK